MEGLKNSSTVLLPVGTVLMTSRASIGMTAINRREMCTNQGFANFICNEKVVLNEYLAYWLPTHKQELIQLAGGTTFKEISKSTLARVNILLPPLPEQRRIVTILHEADEIRKLRRQANEKMQEIIEALFYDMFGNGDPHNNYPEGWRVTTLAKIIVSTQYGLSESLESMGDIGVLRMNNITTKGWLDLTDLKYFPLAMVDVDKYDLRPKDILFNRTNSKELVGKTGLWEVVEGQYTFASYIIRVRLKEDMASPEYIWTLLNSSYGKQQVFSISKQAVNMANINTQELGSIQVVLPPLSLQKKFAGYVEFVRSQLRINDAYGRSLDTFYQSLLARAFTGELTASWREAYATVSSYEALLQELAAVRRNRTPIKIDTTEQLETVRPGMSKREELLIMINAFQRVLLQKIDEQPALYVTASGIHDEIFTEVNCTLDMVRRELHALAEMGLLKELSLPVEAESGSVRYIIVYRSLLTDDDSQQQDLKDLTNKLDSDYPEEVLV